MNKILLVICNFLFIAATFSQNANEDFFKKILGSKYFDEYYRNNIFSLQKSPEVNIQDVINSKISELISHGEYFKYYYELLNGYYVVTIEKEKVILKILNTKKGEIYKTKAIKDKDIVDVVEFNIHRVDKYINLELVNSREYINESAIINSYQDVNIDSPPVNFVYKSGIIIDKQILDNLTPYVSGKILNRSITRSKMKTLDHQPCDLYSDITAAAIVPYDNGAKAKVFTVDQSWDRIIWWDRDKSGLDFGPLTLYNPVNPGQYYDLDMPSDITIGTSYIINNGYNYNGNIGTDTYYPLIITDRINNRIVKIKYRISIKYYSWGSQTSYNVLDDSFTSIKNNIPQPFSLSLHSGYNLNSENDDVLWYTEGLDNTNKSLVAINPNNGLELQRVTNVSFQRQSFNINASRLSIYRAPDGLRNVMVLIDETRNALVSLKLENSGLFSSSNPTAFSVLDFGYQKLRSAVVTSNNNGLDASTIWAVTDGGNGGCEGGGHCGYINTLKIGYVGNTPVFTEYLASYWMGRNSDKSFVNINNLQIQNGFIDIFTMEAWNNTYGIRRFKPGIDVISDFANEYCKSTNNMNMGVRLTNPSKIKVTAEYKTTTTNWQYKAFTINGSELPNGIMNIPSGSTNFTISVNYAQDIQPPEEEQQQIRITLHIAPQDEDPNTSPNKIIKQYIRSLATCYSGGGCPYIYVNDGDSLRQDNNILHRSEFSDYANQDITDKYKLSVYPKIDLSDNTCTLELRELNNDLSYLDKIELRAIDHPLGSEITITENRDIVLYFPQIISNPTIGLLNDSDITCELYYDSTCSNLIGDSSDGLSTEFGDGNYKSKFIKATKFAIETVLKTVSQSFSKIKKRHTKSDIGIVDSVAVIFDPERDRISLPTPVKDYAGQLIAYDFDSDYNTGYLQFARREKRSVVAIPLGGSDVSIDSIYTDWWRDFDMTFFVTCPIYYGGFNENIMELSSAVHSRHGDVMDFLSENDDIYAMMDNETSITLKFANTSATLPEGWTRDYVIITDGRYEVLTGDKFSKSTVENNTTPKVFKLHQNYPNPFNPIATIKYDIPKNVLVLIKVYDMLGREIKTLVNEVKDAGYYEVTFDGKNNASGVYFYRLEAGDYVKSMKMVLIK